MTQKELFIKELGPFSGPVEEWDPFVYQKDALELIQVLQAKRRGQFQISCSSRRIWTCDYLQDGQPRMHGFGFSMQEAVCKCVEQALSSSEGSF